MEKLIQSKKNIKLNDIDKKVLLAYSNMALGNVAKSTSESTTEKKILKV